MDTEHQPAPADRLLSIDALRGFDMLCIIGGTEVVAAAVSLVSPSTGAFLNQQFDHVTWEGFRFEDLIFPLFVFVVGAVLPFSLTRRLERGESRFALYRHVVLRALALVALGLLYNGILKKDVDWSHQRYAGVLQRIGICYFFAAVAVMHLGDRGLAGLTAALLAGYWAMMRFIPAGGYTGDYSMEHCLSSYVDQRWLPGALYYKLGDNEGILSHIPAVASATIGALAGRWLRRAEPGPWRKVGGLVAAGAGCLAAGWLWSFWFPIVKNIWTSSFVLWAGGWSLLLLALFYAAIDVLGRRRWAFFLVVIGANPITIYLLERVVDFDPVARFFVGHALKHVGRFEELLLFSAIVAIKWGILLLLYRKKIFLKV